MGNVSVSFAQQPASWDPPMTPGARYDPPTPQSAEAEARVAVEQEDQEVATPGGATGKKEVRFEEPGPTTDKSWVACLWMIALFCSAIAIVLLSLGLAYWIINSASATVANSTSTATEATRYLYVDTHNSYRIMHCNTPNLTHSQSLEDSARSYVATCPTGHSSSNERNGAGENMFWSGSLDNTAGTVDLESRSLLGAVQAWHNEMSRYNYTSGTSNGGEVGHFTQVVWRSTTAIGCAVNTDCDVMPFLGGTKRTVVVCHYDPPGNYVGATLQQVGEVALSNGACPGPIAPSIAKRLRHAANLEAAANEKDPSRMDAMVTAALASVANALLPPNALLNMTGPSA